jgi:hypothetical protein
MRIKSYFAPSVQNAIGLARREFGDDITLVTSHAASLESRHLGEYEVVFAIEEPPATTEVIKGAAAQPFQFKQVLEEAVAAAKACPGLDIPTKLDHIGSLLIEVGVDASLLRALMTIIQRCVDFDDTENRKPVEPKTLPGDEAVGDTAPTMEQVDPVTASNPQFTAAELAFLRSVTVES